MMTRGTTALLIALGMAASPLHAGVEGAYQPGYEPKPSPPVTYRPQGERPKPPATYRPTLQPAPQRPSFSPRPSAPKKSYTPPVSR